MNFIYKTLTIFLVFAALFCVPVMAADEYNADFDLDTEDVGSLCPLSTRVISAELENEGTLDDEYVLSTDSDWLTIGSPTNLEIGAGETEYLSLFVTPGISAEPGEYRLSITAESEGSGERYTKYLYVDVLDCYGVTISADVVSIDSCIGAEEKILVTVINDGKYDEDFTLTTNYGYFEVDELTLGSMESVEVDLIIPVNLKEQDVLIMANAGSILDSETIEIRSSDLCYSVAVLNIPPVVTVCQGDDQVVDINIKNTGATDDSYVLSNSFMLPFGMDEIAISSKEFAQTILTIPTADLVEGTYEYSISATSAYAQDKVSGTLVVEDCFSANLGAFQNVKNSCPMVEQVFDLVVENTGKKSDSYQLLANRGTFSEPSFSLEAGESIDITLTLESEADERGERKTEIILMSPNVEETLAIGEVIRSVDECYAMELSIDPVSVESQDYDGVLYAISVKNEGFVESTYSAYLSEGPEWAFVDPEEFNIESGDSRGIFLYVQPDIKAGNGVYNLAVTVENNGGISKTVKAEYVFMGSEISKEEALLKDYVKNDTVTDGEDVDDDGFKWSSILVALVIGVIVVLLIVFGPDLFKEDDEDEFDTFVKVDKIEPPIGADEARAEELKCVQCGKVFSTERSLKIHTTVVHRNLVKKEIKADVKKDLRKELKSDVTKKVHKAEGVISKDVTKKVRRAVKREVSKKPVKKAPVKRKVVKKVPSAKKKAAVVGKKAVKKSVPVKKVEAKRDTDDKLKGLKSARKDDIRKILDNI